MPTHTGETLADVVAATERLLVEIQQLRKDLPRRQVPPEVRQRAEQTLRGLESAAAGFCKSWRKPLAQMRKRGELDQCMATPFARELAAGGRSGVDHAEQALREIRAGLDWWTGRS